MYRWNSHNTCSTRNRSNLSDSASTSVISARFWIWNVFKAVLSVLSIFQLKRALRKVNTINCPISVPQPTFKSYFFSFLTCWSCSSKEPDSSTTSKSSSINNCNISSCNDVPLPKKKKMTQILSKTMTLLGILFLIHFIIMSTFAEREGKCKFSIYMQCSIWYILCTISEAIFASS